VTRTMGSRAWIRRAWATRSKTMPSRTCRSICSGRLVAAPPSKITSATVGVEDPLMSGQYVLGKSGEGLDDGFDQPVTLVPAAVDHVDVPGLGVGEDEEVVAQHLHLHNGLVDGHGPHDEPLGPDHLVLRLLRPRSEEHTSELQSRENLVC